MARSELVETLLSRSLAKVPHADENFEKQSLNTSAVQSASHPTTQAANQSGSQSVMQPGVEPKNYLPANA